MNNECVLRCEENYENITENNEYICKAKECADRTPFSNGSCSLKEDLDMRLSNAGCYLWKGEEDRWTCMTCPDGYSEVFILFFVIYIFIFFFYNTYYFFRLFIVILRIMMV
jgi:hypothetical protein